MISRMLTVAASLLRKVSLPLVILVLSLALTGAGLWHRGQLHRANPVVSAPHVPQKTHRQTAAEQKPAAVEQATPGAPETTAPTAPAATGGTARPKTNSGHALVFSPASVTLLKYTPVINMGFKPQGGVMFTSFTASTSDGAAVSLPFSSDSAGVIGSNSPDPAPYKTYWPMHVNATYSTVGTHSYTLTAKSASGVTYSGTVQVIIKDMPIFTVNATGFVINVVGDDAELLFSGGSPSVDLSQVAGYAPTVTLAVGGQSCSVDLANIDSSDDCDIDTSGMGPGNYAGTIVFENQYQRVLLNGLVVVH